MPNRSPEPSPLLSRVAVAVAFVSLRGVVHGEDLAVDAVGDVERVAFETDAGRPDDERVRIETDAGPVRDHAHVLHLGVCFLLRSSWIRTTVPPAVDALSMPFSTFVTNNDPGRPMG
jgi:hypothetical protein